MGNCEDNDDSDDGGNDDDDNNGDNDNNDDDAVFTCFDFAVVLDLPFLTFFVGVTIKEDGLRFFGVLASGAFSSLFFSHGRLFDLVQVWDNVFFLVEEKMK
jgi:hypothetical protein